MSFNSVYAALIIANVFIAVSFLAEGSAHLYTQAFGILWLLLGLLFAFFEIKLSSLQ